MGEGVNKLIPEDIKEGSGNTEVTAYTPDPNIPAHKRGTGPAELERARDRKRQGKS